jgi:hypothetical protein
MGFPGSVFALGHSEIGFRPVLTVFACVSDCSGKPFCNQKACNGKRDGSNLPERSGN